MPDNDACRQAEEQTRRLAWDPQLVPVLVDTKQRWSWWFMAVALSIFTAFHVRKAAIGMYVDGTSSSDESSSTTTTPASKDVEASAGAASTVVVVVAASGKPEAEEEG
ncbi:probable auxin efflux carrier component 5a [Oryza sativa Japonica Group]|uniref:probable auxin efflux carrier component 5a n=1 Tax=Oryza sativa subsp. japonica TaxID=39947 RepID=UPI00339BF633